MNTRLQPASSSEDDAFRKLLAIADNEHVPVASGLMEKIQANLAAGSRQDVATVNGVKSIAVSAKSIATQSASKPTTRLSIFRRWTSICGIAVLGIAALQMLFRTPEVLGGVLEALRSRPWVHIACEDFQGNEVEAWLSQKSYSVRRSDSTFFLERASDTVDVYYPAKRQIIRSRPTLAHQVPEFDSLVSLLNSVPGSVQQFGGMEVAEVATKAVTDGARKQTEHVVRLKAPDSSHDGELTVTLTLIADSDTELPSDCTAVFLRQGVGNNEGHVVKMKFSYPEDGPRDIHALGAPETVTRTDVTNPELNPLYRIVQTAMEKGRRGLKQYRALIGSNPHAPDLVVWRKGSKWRFDFTGGRTTPPSDDPGLTPPDVDVSHWRSAYPNGATKGMVFDGADTWALRGDGMEKQSVPPFAPAQWLDSRWIGTGTLEPIAYPVLREVDGFVMTMTQDDPEGQVLVEYSAATPVERTVHRTRRYWLEPKYGYAVVKFEMTDSVASEDEHQAPQLLVKHPVQILAGYQKSPDGIWYPTRVRNIGSRAWPTMDKPVTDDAWDLYYVDFQTEIPESVFDTTL